MALTLIPTGLGKPDAEDWEILDDGRGAGVGRVYRTSSDFRGDGYAWFVYGSSRAGFEETLETAKARWKDPHELA
jgi:hypothetical protein